MKNINAENHCMLVIIYLLGQSGSFGSKMYISEPSHRIPALVNLLSYMTPNSNITELDVFSLTLKISLRTMCVTS